VQATSIAAAAAAVGAVTDHALASRNSAPAGSGGEQTLIPTTGQWRTVSTSAELTESGVRGFDLGTVVGFVTRTGGALHAVSGICTHLGCRLALDAVRNPGSARRGTGLRPTWLGVTEVPICW
jgi:Rieske Fe-S protein